ncbi:MAG TPA: methyltransferase domain-containing protein, partial [Planctomycetaceae bacterium]|nr:methyltransferase domain-containing protein [Planctomycetaceae bacterium]
DPTLPVQLHRQALKGLARLNRVSGIARVLFGELRQVARAVPDRPLRVLDVACGGADVLIACARRAAREGLRFQFTGCDRSPTALEAASEAARRHGCSDCRFYGHDILAEELPESYDVVMNTLFLHHLDEEEVVTAVSHMAAAARRRLLIDDLLRSRFGYWLAQLACRTLTRSPVVHFDGPVSVQAAFSEAELATLLPQAVPWNWQFRRHWPERILCVGRPQP